MALQHSRVCGTCTLCCKVYIIPEIDKKMGSWCKFCAPGKGCGKYDSRPNTCRTFNCLWILTDFLGPEWKPERSKFVMSINPQTNFLIVQVDPGAPRSWRAEPYHSQIRKWAIAGDQTGRRVVVFVNDRATVVLPDGEHDVGVIATGEKLQIQRPNSPNGRFGVTKV